LSRPPEFDQLSYDAQAFYLFVLGHPIAPDGTIAVLKHREKIYRGVTRTWAIAPRERRRFDRIVTELFASGFFTLHGDRVVVPHWHEQQAWRKGPPPPMRCEPERPTLARLARESSTTLLDHFSDTSPTLLDDSSDTSRSLLDDSSSATSRNHSAPSGQSGSQLVGSARIGWESPTGAPPAGVGDDTAGDNHASNGRAKVVDLSTGEIIDPDDFYDPPPEERERQAATIPHEGPTPDEADEAAGLFDVEEGATF
jgi:hypothetical protein